MSKFHNIKTGGYDSKREARRAEALQLLQKIGAISELEMQVKFQLLPKQKDERSVTYIADFSYWENGVRVVEDVKSKITKTPVYVVKRKLMLFFHGIKVRET
jgi:hypothetical protein